MKLYGLYQCLSILVFVQFANEDEEYGGKIDSIFILKH